MFISTICKWICIHPSIIYCLLFCVFYILFPKTSFLMGLAFLRGGSGFLLLIKTHNINKKIYFFLNF